MYELTFKFGEETYKCLATYSDTFNCYMDMEGFCLKSDNIIWVDKL